MQGKHRFFSRNLAGCDEDVQHPENLPDKNICRSCDLLGDPC
jgi:hypothetical protein